MSELKGKKLLVLGATGLICDAVKIAKSMGIYTIVTDYNADAPAKKIADKSYNVSTTDIEELVRIARDEKIDGVFTGYSDVNTDAALRLCERLELPFYANREQLALTANKLAFKQLCREHNVPTVKQYELDSRCLPEHLAKIEYPVMVKPADSYASKGCRVCLNEEELLAAVEAALPFSATKQIIVEQYMDTEVCEDVGISYLFVDGTPYLIYNGDRYTNKQQKGFAPLTAAVIAPSDYVDEYMRDVDPYAKEMFTSIGIKNGRVSIQAFHDKNGYYFYEMGFRLTGGRQYFAVERECGANEVVALIQYALTGKIDLEELERCTPKYKNYYCDLVVICKAGTISRVEGIDEILTDSRVIDVAQISKVGDVIKADGTQNQVLCRICIRDESKEKLLIAISEIGNKVMAYDENGEPMLLHIWGT